MRQITPTIRSPRNSSGVVSAREREVAKSETINALLTRPVAVLPAKLGDPVLPFARGLWNDIRPLLKPDTSVTTLRKAMATYVHSRRYQIAVSRPGSLRHDINGVPVSPISDADRLDAQAKLEGFQARDGSGSRKSSSALPSPESKTAPARAGSRKDASA